MKTIIYISAIVVGAMAANAQSGNYKMPYNKVAKPEKKVTLSYKNADESKNSLNASANYKSSFIEKQSSGAVVPMLPFDIVVSPLDNSSNYKAMNAGRKKRNAEKQNMQPEQKPDSIIVKN